jgi:hypothetical protein
VPLHAKPEEVARALQAGASASRWVTSPPRVNTWDDCTAEVLDTNDELLHSRV